MFFSKLNNGIYGPPITLPTSEITPDGKTYCGGFDTLPIEQLNTYGYFEAVEPLVPEGHCLTSYGNGVLADGKVSYPDATFGKITVDSISMRQCRLYLLNIDLLDDVDGAISQMGKAAQIEWEYAATVERSNPLIAGLQQLFQWSDDQMDTMFLEGSKL